MLSRAYWQMRACRTFCVTKCARCPHSGKSLYSWRNRRTIGATGLELGGFRDWLASLTSVISRVTTSCQNERVTEPPPRHPNDSSPGAAIVAKTFAGALNSLPNPYGVARQRAAVGILKESRLLRRLIFSNQWLIMKCLSFSQTYVPILLTHSLSTARP